jgi:hypothetical protein
MTPANMDSSVDAAMLANNGQDCCNDADAFSKTGKLCKTDLSCQAVTFALQTGHVLALMVATAEPFVPNPDRVILTLDPNPVWRPPALI